MTNKTVEIVIYRPGESAPTTQTVPWPNNYREMNAAFSPMIGGRIEHISVLFEGERMDMFVTFDDPDLPDRDPLLVNEAATQIYHGASIARGDKSDRSKWPKIHGVAIITRQRVWF